MPKYSTGESSTGRSGDACEACGDESTSLTEAIIEGATLFVCSTCAPRDASNDSETRDEGTSQSDRERNTVQKVTDDEASLWTGDTSRWETEGTGYTNDQLPHLVENYGAVVKEARRDAGIDVGTVAVELGVDEMDVLAVERGQAVQQSIGGSVIEGLEELLNVTLVVE